jgi:hypothetical protein
MTHLWVQQQGCALAPRRQLLRWTTLYLHPLSRATLRLHPHGCQRLAPFAAASTLPCSRARALAPNATRDTRGDCFHREGMSPAAADSESSLSSALDQPTFVSGSNAAGALAGGIETPGAVLEMASRVGRQ